jgi:hypothetical protein
MASSTKVTRKSIDARTLAMHADPEMYSRPEPGYAFSNGRKFNSRRKPHYAREESGE